MFLQRVKSVWLSFGAATRDRASASDDGRGNSPLSLDSAIGYSAPAHDSSTSLTHQVSFWASTAGRRSQKRRKK